MDELLALGVPLAFAVFVTAHVALVAGLAARHPRWRALVAAVALPMAPFWGAKEKMRGRTAIWALGAAVYVALRVAARH